MKAYTKVAKVEDLPSGSSMLVSGIDRVDICLLNEDKKYYAVTNICTHKGGPINQGRIQGKFVICPFHNAAFNLENGRASWPAPRDLRTYEVKIENGCIYIGTNEMKSQENTSSNSEINS